MNCKATTKNGKPCQAQAQAGKDFCFVHDPTKAEAVKAAQSRGGSSLAVLDPKDYKPWRGTAGDTTVLRTPTVQEVVTLLADTVDEVKTGKIDPKIANAVGYLAGVILRALQYEALEDRLAAIEQALGVDKQ